MIVWDAATGKTLLTYQGHATGEFQIVQAVAWSPDGARIVSGGGDKTAQIWDATSGERLLTYTNPDITASLGIEAISWSPNDTHIVSAGGDALVWSAFTGKTLFTYGPLYFGGLVLTVAWSPDGTRIVSGAGDTLRVWQPE